DVLEYFATTIPFEREETVLMALSADQFKHSNVTRPHETSRTEMAAALLRGEVAMSYGFSRHFNKAIGDLVELRTREGTHTFRVGAVVTNYGGPTGSLTLDTGTFDRWFVRDGATTLSVWSQLAPDEVEQRIRSAVGDRQPLFFAHGQDGVLTATKVVGRFSALLYLVISVSAIFSAGALLNLLSGAVTARKRELAIMQVAGARPSDIALGVIADSLILSTLSIISGLIVGALAGHVL